MGMYSPSRIGDSTNTCSMLASFVEQGVPHFSAAIQLKLDPGQDIIKVQSLSGI